MKKLFFSFAMILLAFCSLQADPGDTLIVQTYTFEEQNNPETDYDSPGRRTFNLPEDDGTTYQKILMYYTLKCFEDGTAGGLGFDCGEWDYTSHTFLYEHTGVLDSNDLVHPRFLANNQDFEMMSFSDIPLTNTYTYESNQVVIDEIISESIYWDGLGESLSNAFSQANSGRVQFYVSYDQLVEYGATAGDFQKIALGFSGATELTNVRISATQLSEAPESLFEGDLNEVYFHPNLEVGEGLKEFNLQETLSWDGTSGVLLELSFDDASSEFSLLGGSGNSYMAAPSVDDQFILFDGGDQVSVPAEIFNYLEDEVTIFYWLKGTEEFQPENGTTFEGVNADNQRVLNSHNPWGNGRVYWDAGQDGGYDRIDKQANDDDFSEVWNHWAFTKNTTTEEMKIFLNGEEWHSGDNKDNLMTGIEKFNIGSAAGWDNFYRGAMDDFYVFDKELSAEEIQAYMNSSYNSELPFSENILANYDFNNGYGELQNNAVSEFDGLVLGNPALVAYNGSELSDDILTSEFSPSVAFYRGEYTTSEEIVTYTIEEVLPPISVIEYEVVGHDVEVVNVNSYYEIGESNVYGVDGELVESTSNAPEVEIDITNEELSYFSAPFEVVNRIELGRFITPYGIGLDLEEGWTWVYDVSDFEPLLHGEVDLEAGNWQELLDLKFAFIEGTPPRDVERVENIWAGNWQLSSWDETVQEQTIDVQDGEEMFKVRATTSGHWFGQGNNCAEFCYNTHKLKVNSNTEYTWEIMQECADNPLYPQGGTWIYDRAGWCPGAPVTTRELEISDFVNGDEFTVEYDIDYDPYGNYWLMGQLVSYGSANFQNEVEISEILAPSDFRLNSRINPICDNPIIRIRNNGSEPLTSCVIEYGLNGNMQSYTWTGNLGFLETEDVTLQYNDSQLWLGDDEELLTFDVEVSSPNGVQDENIYNNATSSSFLKPVTYAYDEDEDDNRIIIETSTNSAPWETKVTLKNLYGATHWTSNYTDANTLHRDTLTLNSGCYLLHIEDTDDDGLSFFANNDGSGSVRIKEVGGWYFETFENNYGKEIKHHFNFQTNIYDGIEEEILKEIRLYPNPTTSVFYLEGVNLLGNLKYQIVDATGRLVQSGVKPLKSSSDRIEINLENEPVGVYTIITEINGDLYQKRIQKL